MKIVFMGTPDFAVPALKALAAGKHEVTLVVTQPDRPRGRSGKPAPCPVKACAEELGIPTFSPERVKKPEAVERLKQEKPDLIVVAAYGQILSKEILEIPPFGCINIHGSLLPAYRGAAPIQWSVIHGDKVTGITIMQMNEGMDTGDILLQKEVPLDPEETSKSLYEKLSLLGGEMIEDAADRLFAGELTPVPQDPDGATYAPMLSREMGKIDWSASASSIGHQVRGMDPWPSAYTYYQGKMLKIWGAVPTGEETGAAPGTILSYDKDRIYVAAGGDVLALTEVQMEGKKRMRVHDFLLGMKPEIGKVMG